MPQKFPFFNTVLRVSQKPWLLTDPGGKAAPNRAKCPSFNSYR